jgi:tetratricopeptide (TPR) repeat protein
MKFWQGPMNLWRVTVLSLLLVAVCLWLFYNRETEGQFQHGNALRRQGDWEGAIHAYDQALQLDPKYAEAYLSRGVAYGKRRDWDGAIADFSSFLEFYPQNAHAYCNRGWAHARKGEPDLALADCCRTLELDPQDWQARYPKAYALEKSGKQKEALEAYMGFLKDAPPQAGNFTKEAQERAKALTQ